jgi:hypothetical protein
MKNNTRIALGARWPVLSLLMLIVCASSIHAQNEKLGNVGFVNAIDSEQPTFLKRNNEIYNRRGYASGQMTMGAAFPEGPTEFSVENESFGVATLGVVVSEATPCILIAYLDSKKNNDGSVVFLPKLAKLASKASKQLDVFGLYATSKADAVAVSVNGSTVNLPPLKLVPLTNKAPFTFQAGPDQRLMNISSMASGRIVIVVFDRQEGGVSATLYEDAPTLD